MSRAITFALVFMVRTYQTLFPSLRGVLGIHGQCRYVLSCSEYAVAAIQREGPVKGIYASLLRILSCRPGARPS